MKCQDCVFHKVVSDPDPHDWFCQDDVAVICHQSPNKESEWGYDTVDVALRPYQVKNVESPDWCPRPIIERNDKLKKILKED